MPPEDLIRRWVLTEVMAKLTDTPMLELWREHGLVESPLECIARFEICGHGRQRTATLYTCRASGHHTAAFGWLEPVHSEEATLA